MPLGLGSTHPEAVDDAATARARTLARVQGAYYVAAGLWPLVSMRTFERVTGPKLEHWLVKTVGVLVSAIGGVIALGGAERRPSRDVRRLAVLSALGLAGIDVIYAAKRRIPPIYLLDAVAELALVAGWLSAKRDQEQEARAVFDARLTR